MPRKMGKTYNHQQSFFNKTTFFPLLCRSSKKDVKLRNRSSSSSSPDDPSSPKVTCIGKIRRTNKIIGFSSTSPRLTSSAAAVSTITSTTTKTAIIITAKTHGQGKYTRLRRWFSGRNTVGVDVASCTAATRCGGGGSRRRGCARRCSKVNHHSDGNVRVDVDDLEPPIPVVIKNVSQPPEVNLWKRRCGGGVALKSLEPISR